MSNTIRLKNNSKYNLSFPYAVTSESGEPQGHQQLFIEVGAVADVDGEIWSQIEKNAKPWMKQGDLIKLGASAPGPSPAGGDIAHLSVEEAIDFVEVLNVTEARTLLDMETRDPVRAAIQKKLGGEV